jgi:hypothetical protein
MTKSKKNLVMPTDKESEVDAELESSSPAQLLAEHSRQLANLQERLSKIEAVQSTVTLYMPKNLEPLGRSDCDRIISENPAAWFEATEDYKRGAMRLNKGKVFCALNYKNIPGHISAGLKCVVAERPH